MPGMLSYTPFLWLFMLSAAIIMALALYAWRIRGTATGWGFLILMLCALVWVVGFIFETAAQTLDGKILFAKMEYLSLPFLPIAWLYLALSFAGQVRPRTFWLIVVIIPVLTNLIIWLDPVPNWLYGNPRLDTVSAPFAVMKSDYQFWFYFVHAPSGYIFMAIALAVVLRTMYRAQPIYRRQGALLLLAVLLPTVTDLLYVLGFSPIRYYNLTPATFSISGLLLAWNLFGFRFLNILPLARDVIFESLSDGIIVLDETIPTDMRREILCSQRLHKNVRSTCVLKISLAASAAMNLPSCL
ncbi:MAG: histidine kinase N-terminal 7TM domain-containing protein [Chloroflexota bacterium]